MFSYFLLPFSVINHKYLKKTRQVDPNKSYAIQRICIFYNFIYLKTTSGVSVEIQHLVFLYIYNIWCFCTINTSSVFHFLKTAMTRNNLLVFLIFLFNSLTKTLEVDNIDNLLQELIVSHYDCTKMQDNRMYSLNKVAECKISPENLFIAPATITIYQKIYRTDLSAKMCSVKVHVFRYKCGMFSHTSYVHDQNSITYDMIVTSGKCRLAWKSKKLKIAAFDENFDVPIEFDVKTQSNFNDGQAVSSTIECTSGQIKHCTFETLMQRVNLTYNCGTKQVSNRDRKKLPCLLMEGGCETTTLDLFAYTWDIPEKCVMTKTLTQDAKMLHYPLTTDQK